MVCAIDPLAVDAALSMLAEGGNAVDAVIAALGVGQLPPRFPGASSPLNDPAQELKELQWAL
jgi:isoaspartyl peptidase/L-asparaginase-like protein (Ntn-hydrolase superfamily)